MNEHELITLGTGETLDYDKSLTFLDLFRNQVEKNPDAIALVDKFSSMTYRQLDEESARYARIHDFTPHSFVCLEMPRVKEFVVAVLGIWKSGCAYVPIDMAYPPERRRLIREESDGKPCPEGTAYMIYTSGSTGTPKGVMIGHKGLTNYILSTIRINGLKSSDRTSAYRSFSFDSHIEEFYPSLAVGAAVFIIPEEIRHDPADLSSFLERNRISCCYFPTSLATLLYNSFDLKVRLIGAVGERLANVVGGKKGVKFLNTYGPTECTDHISTFLLEDGREYDNIPIGRPLHNGRVFILGKEGKLVPYGDEGELCFASPQLAIGYYNNPELTKERFVCLTIGGEEVRVYKTGDLCRWNADGQLEYIGRIDNQVKLRGFRIELGEIESVALKLSGAKQAVAMVRDERIVLYYTGEEIADSVFSDHLKTRLPEYMIPSVYVHLDSMPLTPNGKTDRKALPEPSLKHHEYVAPSNDIEFQLQSLVAQVLSLDEGSIGVAGSLTSYGLHSVHAMRLATEIYRKFHCKVPISVLRGETDIRAIALYIRSADRYRGFVPRHHKERTLYPAMAGMSGYMKDIRLGVAALVCEFSVRFRTVPMSKMVAALEKLVAAHPSLQVCYKYEMGNYFLYQGKGDIPVRKFVLDREPDEKWLDENVNSIDGTKQPNLMCFTLIEAPAYGYFMLQGSHAVIDFITKFVTSRDFLKALAGLPLEKEEYTIYDFAIDEDEYFRSRAKSVDEAAYRRLVAGRDETLIPYDCPDPPEWSLRKVRGFDIEKGPVDEFCRKYNVTVNNFFCVCYMWALGWLTGNDFTIATGLSLNRGFKEFTNVAGQLLRTFPIVVNDIPPFDAPDFVQRALKAFADVSGQFEEVLERPFYDYYTRLALGWSKDISRKSCFVCDIGILEGIDNNAAADAAKAIQLLGFDPSFRYTPKFNCYFKRTSTTYADMRDGKYVIDTHYASLTYSEDTIGRLHELMKKFIDRIV